MRTNRRRFFSTQNASTSGRPYPRQRHKRTPHPKSPRGAWSSRTLDLLPGRPWLVSAGDTRQSPGLRACARRDVGRRLAILERSPGAVRYQHAIAVSKWANVDT